MIGQKKDVQIKLSKNPLILLQNGAHYYFNPPSFLYL